MFLFLDFDGVLHPQEHCGDVFCRAPLLWRILDEIPDSRVVFSTAWREHHSVEDLMAFVTGPHGERLAHRFLGSTPMLARPPLPDYYRSREMECLAWLEGNRFQGHPWLAIDDLAHWFAIDSPNLYLVSQETGLTEADVPAIIARIQALLSR